MERGQAAADFVANVLNAVETLAGLTEPTPDEIELAAAALPRIPRRNVCRILLAIVRGLGCQEAPAPIEPEPKVVPPPSE